MRKLFRILFFYSGPAVIGADKELSKLCMAELISYAREKQYTYVKLESWDFPCAVNTHNLSFKPTIRKEYIVDLRENWSDFIKKIKKNRRTDIRTAEREGLTFHESRTPRILDDLLRLLAETKSIRLSKKYKDYASLYISYMNRDILHELFKRGIVRAFYVKNKEDILSVSLEAVYHKKAYGLFAGTNLLGYKLKANSLLNFKIIEKLKNEGVEFYNFGGVPSDDSAQGLCFFKSSYGAKEHVCCGGRSHHLQSPFINYLTKVYYRVPEIKLKRIIRKRFSGRN
jgi:lipid II:glycine glycyltransferase (peptidoglycan interpeptide bridge formation enzyme)